MDKKFVMKLPKLTAVIEQDEDGVYLAEVPALPGCISQGQTREEAVETLERHRGVHRELGGSRRAYSAIDH